MFSFLSGLLGTLFDALQPVALALGLVACLMACFLAFFSPPRGLKLIVLTLPIYLTSHTVMVRVAGFFGGSTQVIIFADILILCTFAGIVVARTRLKSWATPNWISWSFLLFIGVSLASLANLPDYDRIRGAMAIITYTQLIVFVVVIETLIKDERALFSVMRYWLYSYVVVLVAGVIGTVTLYAGIDNLTNMNGEQVRATFLFPNQLSLYLVITSAILWPLASVRAMGRRRRLLIRASLPVMLAVLYYTGSRSGMAAFATASAAALFFNRRGRQAYVMVGILSLCVLGLSLRSVGNKGDLSVAGTRYGAMVSSLRGNDAEGLFSFYTDTNAIALKAMADHPVLGGGIGGVLANDITEGTRYEIHNTYLGVMGQTGLLGAGAAILIIALAVFNILKARRYARSPFLRAVSEGCIAALVGTAVHAYANFDWRIRHVWLLLAVSSGLRVASERSQWMAQRAPAPQPDALAPASMLGMSAAPRL
jgi:O-antigen ligase